MSLIPRGFAAVALAAAIIAVPVPASSAAAAQLTVFLPNVFLGEDSAGKFVRVNVGATEPLTASNLKVQLDFSKLSGIATVTQRFNHSECSLTSTTLTCVYPETSVNDPGSLPLPELLVKPLPGVGAGDAGKWTVMVSADGLATVDAEATVGVAEAVDLAAQPDVHLTSTPGGVFPQTLEVDNVGDQAAAGAVALFFGDYAFITTKQYSNCTFLDGGLRSCTFDEELAAGAGYRTSEAVPFKLRQDTLAPGSETLEIEWMTKDDFDLFKQDLASRGLPDFFGQPGTGGKLNLEQTLDLAAAPPQTEIDPTDNFMHFDVVVEGDNGADIAAIGGAASGAAAQVVTINLGAKNLGPATRDDGRVLGFVTVDITLPPGSSLAEMPKDCVAMTSIGEQGQLDPDRGNLAARFVRCDNPEPFLPAGAEVTFPVKLRIDQATPSATGSVTVLTSGCDGCRTDKNPGNDTASVVLNGPSLPKTGVQTGLIAGIGALLAFAGIAFLVLGRRRRPSAHT